MCVGLGISLRTSTYFWTFQHVFLGVVFLLVCGLESFKFKRPPYEQGFIEIISTPIIVDKSDLILLWAYGTIYFVSAMIIFHGVHKEFPGIIRWTLFLYTILQLFVILLLRSIINTKIQEVHNTSLYIEPPEIFLRTLWQSFQASLVAFFIIINLIHGMFYTVHLMIYCYILNKSNLIIQKVVYV